MHRDYTVSILRLDKIHPEISGNKWFKLKYNIQKAKRENYQTLLTFGGAHSNHIAAMAAACRESGLRSIGVIRGENTNHPSPTLINARENGMEIFFLERKKYSDKYSASVFRFLEEHFGKFYTVPEGGNNKEGILGCREILPEENYFDYVLCACGTGATYAGIVSSCKPGTVVMGINVLKGKNGLVEEVQKNLSTLFSEKKISLKGNEELEKVIIENSCITDKYCFSGYAGYEQQLIDFKSDFEKMFSIPLDYVYTSKLFYATFDLMKKKKFTPGSKILIVHSGGLQGNKAFEKRFGIA